MHLKLITTEKTERSLQLLQLLDQQTKKMTELTFKASVALEYW